MKAKIATFLLASTLVLFVISKWKGLAYWQKFAFVAVIYLALGVWAYDSQFWLMAWLMGGILAIVGGFIFIVGDLFNLWRK